MSTRDRVDAFEAWVKTDATPAETACFSRSIVEGFLAVAGAKKVTAAHVATSVGFARDAGLDVLAMETLGALLVRFEGAAADAPVVTAASGASDLGPRASARAPTPAPVAAPTPAPAPKAAAAPRMVLPVFVHPDAPDEPEPPAAAEPAATAAAAASEPVPPAEGSPTEAAEPASEPAPSEGFGVSFRGGAARTTGVMSVPDVTDAPAAPAARAPSVVEDVTELAADRTEIPDDPPRRGPPRTGAPTSRRTPIVAGAIAVAVAGLIVWRSHGESAREATASDHLQHIAPLALDAEFPAGWEVAPDPAGRGAALGARIKASLVTRGGTPGDPDHSAFLAAVPLDGDLAAGGEITEDALVAAATRAETAASARIADAGGTYLTGGCKVSELSGHTAVCRGTARAHGETFALQTYLRVGDERAVIALFMAKLTVIDAAHEADQIVGSFGL